MVCKTKSATIRGIDAIIIDVETDVSDGLPAFDMVGLLSSEVRESRERVKTALKNNGFIVPPKRITINLAPADIRKTGTYFDLAIAVSILMGIGIINAKKDDKYLFVGELGLDGKVVSVNGILPIVLTALEHGMDKVFIPSENINECKLIGTDKVVGVDNLNQLVYMLTTGDYIIENNHFKREVEEEYVSEMDFAYVKGQPIARRAAEIAAAGMHNILLIGTPGAGKSMIAKCMPTILPDLDDKEKLEVAGIQSIAGLLKSDSKIKRPFRSPHHTITIAALTGGGSNPGPGEMSLAHRGVLFLDELPEFDSRVIEALRQPLEEKKVNISRVGGRYVFPADFLMMATSNPCKCGYYPDRNRCKCTEYDVKKYLDKISGPIMDRIDLCVGIEPVKYSELKDDKKSECSNEIKKRVEQAFYIQQDRYSNLDINFNSQLYGNRINEYCPLGSKELKVMEQAFDKMNLSVRSYNKIIKAARTIADLDGSKNIEVKHLAEVFNYRLNY
ncbi:MAG: YifB family Mg chelatase-like AAA ATPase [Lachnospiraceae bacterium]|nr:YifB family Mg chelatase-like AAA ATPase [Lachnospiraceae bacterium]